MGSVMCKNRDVVLIERNELRKKMEDRLTDEQRFDVSDYLERGHSKIERGMEFQSPQYIDRQYTATKQS